MGTAGARRWPRTVCCSDSTEDGAHIELEYLLPSKREERLDGSKGEQECWFLLRPFSFWIKAPVECALDPEARV